MTKKPGEGKRMIPDSAAFEVTIDQYSFRNRDVSVTERERSGYDLTIHRWNAPSAFVQSGMTRAEIAFTVARLQAFLEDTSQDNNIVYTMGCGHEYDSPYRLTRRSRAHCSQHGFQKLTSGEFLPTWRAWTRSMINTSLRARDALYEDER